MDLKKYLQKIGFNSFRKYQEYAISEIIDSIETDIRTTILPAPTGSGKSLDAVVSCLAANDCFGFNSYILTQTKQLQDQYLKEFPFLCKVKGRSNYHCLNSGDTCDVGQCKKEKGFKCPYSMNLRNPPEEIPDILCEYLDAKWTAINSPYTILNYAFAISDKKYAKHMPYRGFGVFDEAHNIEGALRSFLSIKITGNKLSKDLGLEKTLYDYNEDCIEVEDWIDFLKECSAKYFEKVNALKISLSNATTEKDKLYYSMQIDKFEEKSRSLKSTALYIEEDADNWVFNPPSFKENSVEFKPVNIQKYNNLIFGNVKYKVLMSGTVLKKDIFCEEIGIDSDNVKYIPIPSIIPPQQRPIICDYVGSMSYKYRDTTFPALIRRIEMIASNHIDEKGLIHTHSYKINEKLEEAFKTDKRFVFHNKDDREEKLEFFKESNEPKIFCSPYCFEGVDFPGDEARFQIICKAPYPNIKDKVVAVKNRIDEQNHMKKWGWSHRQAALRLSQMYGRTNRGEDDFSITYLLDSALENFLGPETLISDYFLEGVVDYKYNTELELVDISKISWWGRDNLEIQRIIFDDIKNGYNTTNKLRSVYKNNFSDGSFCEVKYALDDMLRSGVIRYVED